MSGKRWHFSAYKDHELNVQGLLQTARRYRLVSFNGINFDMPLLLGALKGFDVRKLKTMCDEIIQGDMKPWMMYEKYDLHEPAWLDHIDLMEVAPGDGGLKQYGGRLHSQRMQDLPIEPDAFISSTDRPILIDYCYNDLETTYDLLKELQEQIDLRGELSNEYQIDVRSKSDAQIAEAVIKKEIERITGKRVGKTKPTPGTFIYTPPAYIKFQTPELKKLLQDIRNTTFIIGYNGRVYMPESLDGRVVNVGGVPYSIGIGGVHSMEHRRSVFAEDDELIVDRDVTGYYPELIIKNRFGPPHLGEAFYTIFGGFVAERTKLKRQGKKKKAGTRKIINNGTYGKFGQPGSIFYSPKNMIHVTLTGQLSILMAIERTVLMGAEVISANTDGFTTRIKKADYLAFFKMMLFWEVETGLNTEEVRYASMHSRDVNSYFAITEKGDVKRINIFKPTGPGLPGSIGISKNIWAPIVAEAVIEQIKTGKPAEETINECRDIRQFGCMKKVDKGGLKNGKFLGKVVRWYYSTQESDGIYSGKTGNLVGGSMGARPMMDLPSSFPPDVDYAYYHREAYNMLDSIDIPYQDPYYAGRTDEVLGRVPSQKTYHRVFMGTGVALCGKKLADIRMRWEETDEVIKPFRYCAKCRREGEL